MQKCPDILVIDDDEDILELLNYNLKKDGYNVSTCNDPFEAFTLAKSLNPDLIISDWRMPGKTGIEILNELKADVELSDIPFFFITCNNNERDVLKALENGADDYLVKPFKLKELRARVKNKLNYVNINIHKELNIKYESIAEKNKDLLDSIKSAKRIQNALLPNEQMFTSLYPDSFILNLPKDWVSGDFFWYYDAPEHLIFALADCTGHGVPGAFMSIIGNTFLNQIVKVNQVFESGSILYFLNTAIVHALNNSKDEITNEGMDIGVCVYDKNTRLLSFSGALNHLYLIRNQKLIEYDGNRYPIGGFQIEKIKLFNTHVIPIEKNDSVYLKTDGYADQFGGEEKKKFLTRNFKDLLLKNATETLPDQKMILLNRFNSWKDNHEQVDDVSVFGIRFS